MQPALLKRSDDQPGAGSGSRSGLGYLRLVQPATELSGGESHCINLATELRRAQHGQTLYILDEPTTVSHPSDIEWLMLQLHRLGGRRNIVLLVSLTLRSLPAALGDRH